MIDFEMFDIDDMVGRPDHPREELNIEDYLQKGQEVLVQVIKEPIGTKGPKVSGRLSLPGRYLVLMPYTEQFGISRKIEDPKERARLRKIIQKLSMPEGMGIIMRTVAQGTRARHFVRDRTDQAIDDKEQPRFVAVVPDHEWHIVPGAGGEPGPWVGRQHLAVDDW